MAIGSIPIIVVSMLYKQVSLDAVQSRRCRVTLSKKRAETFTCASRHISITEHGSIGDRVVVTRAENNFGWPVTSK